MKPGFTADPRTRRAVSGAQAPPPGGTFASAVALLVLLAAAPARADFDLGAPALAQLDGVVASARSVGKRRLYTLEESPAAPGDGSLPEVFSAPLTQLRDAALSVAAVEAAGRRWTVGVATTPGYDEFYLVLTSGGERVLEGLRPLRRLLAPGGLRVFRAGGPLLRLAARLSLRRPTVDTVLLAQDEAGGTIARFTAGELIGAWLERSRVITAGPLELRLFVQSEVDEDGSSVSTERSIYFARFAGRDTQGWAIREATLEPGVAVRVRVHGRILVLLKTRDDRLVVRDAGASP